MQDILINENGIITSYNLTTQSAELMKKMSEIADRMKTPVFHAGCLEPSILTSSDYVPADSFEYEISTKLWGSIGTGVYYTSTLDDVISWREMRIDEKDSKGHPCHLYAFDMAPYQDRMIQVVGDNKSETLIYFVGDLERSLLKNPPSSCYESIDRAQSLYRKSKDTMTELGISQSDFTKWYIKESKRIEETKNLPTEDRLKADSISASFFKGLTHSNGIDMSLCVCDDSTNIGSVIYDIDKSHAYDINFTDNDDYAKLFYLMVQDKILERKLQVMSPNDAKYFTINNENSLNFAGKTREEYTNELIGRIEARQYELKRHIRVPENTVNVQTQTHEIQR